MIIVARAVKDMYVQCSLVVRNHGAIGFAASDTCKVHATSAVEMANGDRMYRCEKHRGIRRLETGPAWETVNVEDPEWADA